jgi:hypothetical protein
MQKPRGKDPPGGAGDFAGWGKALPPVDESLINESFEQFDFPADETDELNDETFGDVGPMSALLCFCARSARLRSFKITNGRSSMSSAPSSSRRSSASCASPTRTPPW